MNETRYLSFEIGPYCNLSDEHPWCPSGYLVRSGDGMMSVERIAECINEATAAGFTGLVAFHFYNEPLLYAERIRAVMELAPDARYLLWSNGTLAAECPELVASFDEVVITDYHGRGNYPFDPDDRLGNYADGQRDTVRCHRPFVEFVVDYAGEAHLCCQDWAHDTAIGNVTTEPFMAVYGRWLAIAEGVRDGSSCPSVCLSCRGVQPC